MNAVEGSVLKHMKALGYRAARMTKEKFPEIPAEVQTLDFSGWPMIVRADMRDDVAYALCEFIEKRKIRSQQTIISPSMSRNSARMTKRRFMMCRCIAARPAFTGRGYLK